MSDNTITKKELQTLIKDEGIKPSELYLEETLLADSVVKKHIESELEQAKKKREEEDDLIPGDDEPSSGDNDGEDLIPD